MEEELDGNQMEICNLGNGLMVKLVMELRDSTMEISKLAIGTMDL